MKYSLILIFTATIAFTVAAPTSSTKSLESREAHAWISALAGYDMATAQHIEKARSTTSNSKLFIPPSCDLSRAVMPVAPTPLPTPDGLKLAHVAIGRGTQNYTCSNSTSDAIPAAIGALASLYNASCIAANYPDLLALIPGVALQYRLPSSPSSLLAPATNIDLSGHHYFTTTTTPVFNLDASLTSPLGIAVGKKSASSVAPANSIVGANNVGNGAVPWLYLTATNASVGNFAAIYRLNTAGGSPPTTCEGMPEKFVVEYASVYWFWMKN